MHRLLIAFHTFQHWCYVFSRPLMCLQVRDGPEPAQAAGRRASSTAGSMHRSGSTTRIELETSRARVLRVLAVNLDAGDSQQTTCSVQRFSCIVNLCVRSVSAYCRVLRVLAVKLDAGDQPWLILDQAGALLFVRAAPLRCTVPAACACAEYSRLCYVVTPPVLVSLHPQLPITRHRATPSLFWPS